MNLDHAAGGAAAGARPRSSPARILGLVYVAWALTLAGNQVFTLLLFFLLTPPDVGLVNWGTATGAIVFYILEGGVETALVIAAKQRPVFLSTMTFVVGTIRVATAGVVVLAWAGGIAFHLLHQREAMVLLLVGLGFVLRSLQTPFSASLQLRDRQATVAMLGLVQVIARFAALGLVLVLGLLSVPAVLIASLAGDVLGLAALGAAARHRPAFDKTKALPAAELARQISRAAPLLTASQAVIMLQSRADWLLVAAFTSYAALANYSIANKAVELLVLIGSVFGRNALPWLVEGWSSRNLTKVLRALTVGVSVLSLVLAVFGAGLLHLAFGNKYAGANPVIPILAALGPALVLYQVVQFAALGRRRAIDTVISGGTAVAAQIAVDLVAIPRIGILGAALGMCAFAGVGYPILLLLAVRNKVISGRLAKEFAVGAAAVPALLLTGSALMRLAG